MTKTPFQLNCSLYDILQHEARYHFHQPKIFDEFLTLFLRLKSPDIKVGESLDFVIDTWREESLNIVLVCLFVGTQHKVPSESGIWQG